VSGIAGLGRVIEGIVLDERELPHNQALPGVWKTLPPRSTRCSGSPSV